MKKIPVYGAAVAVAQEKIFLWRWRYILCKEHFLSEDISALQKKFSWHSSLPSFLSSFCILFGSEFEKREHVNKVGYCW